MLCPTNYLILSLLFLCSAVSLYAHGSELLVPKDESRVIQVRNAKRILLTNPRICDAVVVSPHEIVVNGLQKGKTTLMIWDKQGRKEVTITCVAYGADIPSRIRKDTKKLFGFDTVDIKFVGSAGSQTIVLRGIVPTENDAVLVEDLAKAHFSGTILNLLETEEQEVSVEQQLKEILGPGQIKVYGLPRQVKR